MEKEKQPIENLDEQIDVFVPLKQLRKVLHINVHTDSQACVL